MSDKHKYLIRFIVDGNISLAAASATRILNEIKSVIDSMRTTITFTDCSKHHPGVYQCEITFWSQVDLVGVAKFFKDVTITKPSEGAYVLLPDGYPKFGISKMNINQAWEGESLVRIGPDPNYTPTVF